MVLNWFHNRKRSCERFNVSFFLVLVPPDMVLNWFHNRKRSCERFNFSFFLVLVPPDMVLNWFHNRKRSCERFNFSFFLVLVPPDMVLNCFTTRKRSCERFNFSFFLVLVLVLLWIDVGGEPILKLSKVVLVTSLSTIMVPVTMFVNGCLYCVFIHEAVVLYTVY